MLGVSTATVIGHLHYLWWWALDYAPDGDLSQVDLDDILLAARWEGGTEFIDALINCGPRSKPGFLERPNGGQMALTESAGESDAAGLVLHDWSEYGGRLGEITRQRSAAGKKGAQVRWGADGKADGSADGGPVTKDGREEEIREEKKRKTVIADGWQPSTSDQRWFAQRLPDRDRAWQERETEKFINHAQSTGRRVILWGKAWQNWMLQADEWADSREPSTNGTSASDALPDLAGFGK